MVPNTSSLLFDQPSNVGIHKLNEVLNYIEDAYVDTVEKDALIEDGIQRILKDLDPHSFYIPKDQFKDVNEGVCPIQQVIVIEQVSPFSK